MQSYQTDRDHYDEYLLGHEGVLRRRGSIYECCGMPVHAMYLGRWLLEKMFSLLQVHWPLKMRVYYDEMILVAVAVYMNRHGLIDCICSKQVACHRL